jgi:hypothetical protein
MKKIITFLGVSLVLVLMVLVLYKPPVSAATLSIDSVVSKDSNPSTATIVSPSLSTTASNELLLAFISTDARSAGITVKSVTGGGLTWTLVKRTNIQLGTSEIWKAFAPAIVNNAAITATLSQTVSASMTVMSFSGVDPTTPIGAVAGNNAASGAPTVSLTTTRDNSWVFGVANDYDKAIARTLGPNQTLIHQFLTSAGDTYWIQQQTNTTPLSGTLVTINDTAPTIDRFNISAVEILPNVSVNTPPDITPPTVAITNPSDQSVATGTIAVSASAGDNVSVSGVQFFVDGVKLGVEDTSQPYSVSWNTFNTSNTMHTLLAVARDAAGNKATSTPVSVAVNNPPHMIILQPTQNASFSTSTITISYTEQGDMTGVDGARFQLDNGPVMQDPTFDGNFQLTNVSPGSHMLMGFLTQLEMMVAGSDATPVTFTVTAPDTLPPTVLVTNPIASSTVSGTITITANAADNIGVAGVQFQVDGTNLGVEDTSSPYSTSWNTGLFSTGAHIIRAIARDAALNTTISQPVTVTITNPNDPAVVGQWSAPVTTPMILVHGILLKTGKVLAWSTGNQAALLDPSTNIFTSVPDTLTDLLCTGQVVLTNGQPLVVGGEGLNVGNASKHNDTFNLSTSRWSSLALMNLARWYPTETVLPDGRVLSISGANGGVTNYVPLPEIYNPKTNVWTNMASSANNINTPSYPFMYVLPDGRVAFAGASEYDTITQILDLNTQSWSTVDSTILPGSSAVMYAPGKVMKSGSAADSGFSGPAGKTTYVIDFNQSTPAWHRAGDMAFPRSFMNLTALPDGTVLVTGGETTKDGGNTANAVKAAELWNPVTETWTTMASEARPRLYHSIALLLPDGRVLVSGGGQDTGVPDEFTAEYYSPGYLFKGARPTITSSPAVVQYGSSFFVGTPDAGNITSVSLVKASAVTHFTNMEQRFINLGFTQTAGGITVNAPANANLATPGIYMLFIVNSNGVPSVAPFVTLPSSFDDSIAPTAPTNLVATGNIGTASLTWAGSTDNVGVTNYNIYRSTVSGFTSSAANRITQTTTTSYTDTGISSGTYYYIVTAQDAQGNTSPASNEASAAVTSDTQAPTVSITSPADASTVTNNVTITASASDNIAVAGVQFFVDGNLLNNEVTTAPYTTIWNSNTVTNGNHVLLARARDTGGNVATSTPITITVNNVVSSAPVTDVNVFKDNNSASASIVSPTFSTASGNEVLLAFIGSDGSAGMAANSISGGGLTWTLVKRTNTQLGTSEIWKAFAPSQLTNVTVTANLAQSVTSSMTVMSFSGVDPVTPIGASGGANGPSGAPTVSLTTTRANSLVIGVGDDWDNATARSLGPNQTLVHQLLASSGDTFWVQKQTNPITAAGTLVTLNDTAPTADRWNLTSVEILAHQ